MIVPGGNHLLGNNERSWPMLAPMCLSLEVQAIRFDIWVRQIVLFLNKLPQPCLSVHFYL